MSEILKLINKSNLTLLGYVSSSVNIKDELISNLSNFYIVGDINLLFNIKSIIRDIKIASIINKNKLDGIIINYNDIENFRYNNDEKKYTFYSRFFENISNLNIKVVITSPTYMDNSSNSYRIPSSGLYRADLAFIIEEDKINIIKSKFTK